MIRPFNLRDLALVHKLSENGVSLHTESALTKNLHPVRGALFSLVGGDFPTYVWKADRGNLAGFIQLSLEENTQHAHIHYLSSTTNSAESKSTEEVTTPALAVGRVNGGPITAVNEQAWLPLLDQAVVEAGQRGIHSLVAEVDESGVALPVLRRADFAIYTRQDVWILEAHQDDPVSPGRILRPRKATDDWEIQLLYANTVPRLVQLVEPMPPLHDGAGWVLEENDELAAFVHVQKGPAATWMRLFVHPNAEVKADEILRAAVQLNPTQPSHPVYCCVRRYQSWVQGALERTGFSLWGSQAVMVKHTVHHLQKPLPDLSAALEAKGVSPTAPIVRQSHRRAHANGAPKPRGTAV
jgi:hypothetical protein